MLDYKVKTFLELCKCMNYRITAEHLNMSQPSVTQHIHLLEDYYNTKLFYYDKKTLYKTKSAIILEKNFEILLNNQQFLEREIKNNKKLINIGATKTIGNYVLNQRVLELINDNNVVHFIIDNTESLFKDLHDNKLDLLVIEGLFDKSLYDWRLYKEEEFVGICNKNHEFANKEIDIEEIFKKGLVVREKGSGTRNIIESELYKYNYTINSFKTVHCISSFELIKDIIFKTDYITFAYKAILTNNSDLATFRISNLNIVREFNYVCLKNTGIDKKINQFNS